MTVAVIGAAGRLGSYIVTQLHAYSPLRLLDIRAGHTSDEHMTPIERVDITRIDQVRQALEGIESVVHVAGIDGHVDAPGDAFFAGNVLGTWNVLQAASELGIRHVVLTSSTSATGLNVETPLLPPRYLPIDEDHPCEPAGAYGISKLLNEVTAAGFARSRTVGVTCIRPTYIAFPELLEHLHSESAAPPNDAQEIRGAFREPRPLLRTYIDPRDLARCYRLALECPPDGYQLFWASAADTFEQRPTLEYLRSLYGGLPPVTDDSLYIGNPRASPVSCSKAREVLGWMPEFCWDDLRPRRR